MIVLALARADVANYLEALLIVFLILVFLNILIRWMPRMPLYSRWFRALLDFITDTTDPYLGIFQRLFPRLGIGGVGFSPVIATIFLMLAGGIAVSLVRG